MEIIYFVFNPSLIIIFSSFVINSLAYKLSHSCCWDLSDVTLADEDSCAQCWLMVLHGELELNFDQLVACLMRALIGSVVPRNVSYVFWQAIYLKLKILVSKLVARGNPHRAQGNSHGARGASTYILLRVASSSVRVASSSYRGLPRGPRGLPPALNAGCLELLCAGRLEIPGNKLWNQNFQFRCFFGPFDRNELYHTPLLSKIWGLGDREFFFVVGSL